MKAKRFGVHLPPARGLLARGLLALALFVPLGSAATARGAPPARAADGVPRIHRARTLPESTPWDLDALSEPPSFEWARREGPVRSLSYRGPAYEGKPTRVFALYATPGSLSGDASRDAALPAVVLVHGGGGTAFGEWAELWAKRGYAAIAMDLAGCGPGRKRLADGGPDQSDDCKFGHIDRPPTDQWTYHAVANVILAHSLLLGFEEVDDRRTALTGISWGGYLTSIVCGLDDRFAAAVPVYGCGFLHHGSVWSPRFAAMSREQRDRWVRLWDPSRYIGSAAMPILFVNGTNDFAYWLESYAETYRLVRSPRNFRITVRMPHGHPQGWAPAEIGLFVDEELLGKTPLARIARPLVDGGQARAAVIATAKLVKAELHFTSDAAPNPKRRWTTREAKIETGAIVADPSPAEARIWFFTAKDARGAVVSSELVFAGESAEAR